MNKILSSSCICVAAVLLPMPSHWQPISMFRRPWTAVGGAFDWSGPYVWRLGAAVSRRWNLRWCLFVSQFYTDLEHSGIGYAGGISGRLELPDWTALFGFEGRLKIGLRR
jgi:hypothetical protein